MSSTTRMLAPMRQRNIQRPRRRLRVVQQCRADGAEAARAAPGQTVVFDVPLLTESSHWRDRVDRVLVVDCDETVQVERVRARNGWPEAQVRAVIAQQASWAQRRAIADAVIVNQGLDLAALDAEVARAVRERRMTPGDAMRMRAEPVVPARQGARGLD